jgi:hypothetical protein
MTWSITQPCDLLHCTRSRSHSYLPFSIFFVLSHSVPTEWRTTYVLSHFVYGPFLPMFYSSLLVLFVADLIVEL